MGKLIQRFCVVLAAASVVAAVLVGCTSDPEPTPVPTPMATPIFASDAEALAAAKKAYAAYLKVLDDVLADGGSLPGRLDEVTVGNALMESKGDVEVFSKKKLHADGRTKFDSMSIQSRSGNGEIAIYVCDDVTGVDVLDESGKSIVQSSRNPRAPFQVDFVSSGKRLIVTDKDLWTGEDFC